MVIDFQWRKKNTLGLCSDRQISDFLSDSNSIVFWSLNLKKTWNQVNKPMCSHTYVVWNPINFKIRIDRFHSLFPHIANYVTFTVTNSEWVHKSAVKMPLVSPAITRFHGRHKQRQNSQFFVLSFHTDSCSQLLHEKVWHRADASIITVTTNVDAPDMDNIVWTNTRFHHLQNDGLSVLKIGFEKLDRFAVWTKPLLLMQRSKKKNVNHLCWSFYYLFLEKTKSS